MANYAFMNDAYEAGLDDASVAALVVAYEDYDFSEEEILEMINNDGVSTYSGDAYGYGDWVQIGDMDFYVFDNYDDAYDAAKKDVEELFDDIGFEGFNLNMSDYVDADWCYDALKESFEFYVDDIANEISYEYDNRLVEECYDNGLIDDEDFETDEDGEIDYTSCTVDEDDLKERYIEWWENNNTVEDAIDEFIAQYGEDELNYAYKNGSLNIDVDRLAEDCVDIDGIAHFISGYDGYEHEVDIDGVDYYVYRHN